MNTSTHTSTVAVALARELHTYVRREILRTLGKIPAQDSRTLGEIHRALPHYSPALITAALNGLVEEREVSRLTLTPGTALYTRAPAFTARHFVPLFNGNPEWAVDARDGTQIALCYTETHARMIAEALSCGSRS